MGRPVGCFCTHIKTGHLTEQQVVISIDDVKHKCFVGTYLVEGNKVVNASLQEIIIIYLFYTVIL